MKSILITGASTGIGEACALFMARQGWQVFAGVRKDKDGKRLQALSPKISAVKLDVTKPAQIKAAMTRVRRKVGKAGLQGLVNNAGVAMAGPMEFLDLDELRLQHEINFIAQVAVAQAALPLLRAGNGRIVNMSSISGRVTSPFLVPYSSSKFALEAYTDGLRRELRPWNLHVASVEPGAISTPIWKKSLETAKKTRSKLPRQAEALYGPAMQRMLKRAATAGEGGVSPETVAKHVHHALSAARPRTRYPVGWKIAGLIWVLRWLPDRVTDWLLTRGLYR
jgi:NAD(P)-dependent dehydrogenase (short-subunit alcohol dehydrogenase family)